MCLTRGLATDQYSLQRISTEDASFLPLHFMLLCPRGEPGWSADLDRASNRVEGPYEVKESEIRYPGSRAERWSQPECEGAPLVLRGH